MFISSATKMPDPGYEMTEIDDGVYVVRNAYDGISEYFYDPSDEQQGPSVAMSRQLLAEERFANFFEETVRKILNLPQEGQMSAMYRYLGDEYKHTEHFLIKNVLSRVAARMTFWESLNRALRLPAPLPPPELVFAESCLQFGANAKFSLELVREVVQREKRSDVPTLYNLANLYLICHPVSKAKELWLKLIAPETSGTRQEVASTLRSTRVEWGGFDCWPCPC